VGEVGTERCGGEAGGRGKRGWKEERRRREEGGEREAKEVRRESKGQLGGGKN